MSTPYQGVPTPIIILEFSGVLLGLLSVLFATKNIILVYPTGILSTIIFVYLLVQAGLLGDMLINAYYFVMSIYGWYYWSRKINGATLNPITYSTMQDWKIALLIFLGSIFFILVLYTIFGKWDSWTALVDTLTTAIFFVGMWLMAKRKIEHWLFWIIGDSISIPLYYVKDLLISSVQYLIFTLIAIYGYRAWKQESISNFDFDKKLKET